MWGGYPVPVKKIADDWPLMNVSRLELNVCGIEMVTGACRSLESVQAEEEDNGSRVQSSHTGLSDQNGQTSCRGGECDWMKRGKEG